MEGIEFDELKSGILNIERTEHKQFSLFDTSYNGSLPPIPDSIYKRAPQRKSNKKQTKNRTAIKDKSISIDNIKMMDTKESLKSTGVGVISITGGASGNNTFLKTVSDKTKREIEARNKELMKIRAHPYIKKEGILTTAEKKLYKFLRNRLSSETIILAKVRLGDIVELNEAITRDSKAFLKIAYKHVDFCIMSSELDLICVVELDDYTHETPEAMRRDHFVAEVLHDCNIPLYRIKCRIDNITPEDTKGIEMCILEYMAPTCPLCGRPMEPKESRHPYNYGHRFYGCMGFYEKGGNQCRHTIDID